MGVALLLTAVLALAACGSGSQSKPSPKASPAQRLATVDGNAAEARAITADFEGLRGKCREAPSRLAGEIWASERDLHQHGIQENAEDVANHLARVAGGLSSSATPTNCASLLAAYLVLREQ